MRENSKVTGIDRLVVTGNRFSALAGREGRGRLLLSEQRMDTLALSWNPLASESAEIEVLTQAVAQVLTRE